MKRDKMKVVIKVISNGCTYITTLKKRIHPFTIKKLFYDHKATPNIN